MTIFSVRVGSFVIGLSRISSFFVLNIYSVGLNSVAQSELQIQNNLFERGTESQPQAFASIGPYVNGRFEFKSIIF